MVRNAHEYLGNLSLVNLKRKKEREAPYFFFYFVTSSRLDSSVYYPEFGRN